MFYLMLWHGAAVVTLSLLSGGGFVLECEFVPWIGAQTPPSSRQHALVSAKLHTAASPAADAITIAIASSTFQRPAGRTASTLADLTSTALAVAVKTALLTEK